VLLVMARCEFEDPRDILSFCGGGLGTARACMWPKIICIQHDVLEDLRPRIFAALYDTMATKRPAPQVHPSRRDQVPGEPKRKRRKPDHTGPKPFKKARPVNALKSQIRSLKRLLEHDDRLPATVRVEKERELQTAEYEFAQVQRAQQRSDIIGKYHKIRFFDRQKATKRLKRARKELRAYEGDEEGREELGKKVDDAEVDVNYAIYFPLEQNYVSLFPRKKPKPEAEEEEEVDEEKGQADTVERQGDPQMWERVKQCMAYGTLDKLRNERSDEMDEKRTEVRGFSKVTRQSKEKSSRSKDLAEGGVPVDDHAMNHKPMANDEDDEDSDGGFFE
jgi:hypothetical protein